jgi:hypothetical protein
MPACVILLAGALVDDDQLLTDQLHVLEKVVIRDQRVEQNVDDRSCRTFVFPSFC